MMLRILATMLLPLGVSACSGQHVMFAHPNTIPDAPGEARVFLDARGDLYPKSGLPAVYVLPERANGSLFEAARGADPQLCRDVGFDTEMAELCAAVAPACSGTSTEACFERWEGVQASIWKRRGEAIAARFSQSREPTIGVLIHGFNNWYRESQANYATAEKQFRRFQPDGRDVFFVEVYWDGCRGNDKGIGCWGKAQSTGPLAGFALRQLFNSVTEARPPVAPQLHWRVLTHSSGAFVAGAIFGDPIAALPQLQDPTTNRWYARFAKHRTSDAGPTRIPQLANVKLGMFAPATPGITFSGTQAHRGGILTRGLTVMTVVQRDDSAVNKLFIGCQRFGASCLGAKREQVCALQSAVASSGTDATVIGYDFTRPKTLWGNETDLHDYSVYVRQAADKSTFFRDFMLTGPLPEDAGLLLVCP
ncbi:hypothetical protein [Sphingomonas hengshuiensis]|uniref:Alpha/beta hydrolase n=1 Tax=Sphingomonas hengshuiensis TaxID=1609977 RepID=A0A7U4LGV4_9SPHN|nr:hypothetical protein [Sphingomonas hengshuiensis]AJP73910.1 hypothetical protein TS85_22080 [Sphingomonas hengshuiensis]